MDKDVNIYDIEKFIRQHKILLINSGISAEPVNFKKFILSMGFTVDYVSDFSNYDEVKNDVCNYDLVIINIGNNNSKIKDIIDRLEKIINSFIPILVMAEEHQLSGVRQWINSGADDFIIKPVNENMLYARIRSLLRMKDFKERLQKHNLILKKEMDMAKALQKNLMENRFPRVGKYSIATKYIPAFDLGGDYYDIYSITGSLFGIFIADVAGHGVQAALITMIVKGVFDSIKKMHKKPSSLMKDLNEKLIPMFETLGTFVTAFSIIIDSWTGKAVYSSAGHPPQYLFKSSKAYTLNATGGLLGLSSSKRYEEKKTKLEAQSMLLLYTDGLTESINSEEKPFGEKNVKEYCKKSMYDSSEKIIEGLLEKHDEFVAAPDRTGNEDDINIIVVKAEY